MLTKNQHAVEDFVTVVNGCAVWHKLSKEELAQMHKNLWGMVESMNRTQRQDTWEWCLETSRSSSDLSLYMVYIDQLISLDPKAKP